MRTHYLFLLLSLFFVTFSFVGASFACGTVTNAENGMSPAWFTVKIHYTDNQTNSADCEVSPSGNKFCCDTKAIPPEESWHVGREVTAQIFDLDNGYLSNEVSMTISGDGYDVFPPLSLEKIISFNSEIPSVFIDMTSFSFDVVLEEPFTSVFIFLNGDEVSFCDSCNMLPVTIELLSGMNTLEIVATDGFHNVTQSFDIVSLSSLDFSRSFVCDDCLPTKVSQNTLVTVDLDLSFSDDVDGFMYREFVPVDWNIESVEGDGFVSQFDTEYNVIAWTVFGDSVSLGYTALSPNVGFLDHSFEFYSTFEDFDFDSSLYTVSGFVPFFSSSSSKRSSFSSLERNTSMHVSSEMPLVFDEGTLIVGLYTKETFAQVHLFVDSFEANSLQNIFDAYSIRVSEPLDSFESMYVRYAADKVLLEKYGYNGLRLFVFDQEWIQVNFSLSQEDDSFLYYEGSVPVGTAIAFQGIVDDNYHSFFISDVHLENPSFFGRFVLFVETVFRLLFYLEF